MDFHVCLKHEDYSNLYRHLPVQLTEIFLDSDDGTLTSDQEW